MFETFETKMKEYLPDFIYQVKDISQSADAIDTQIKKLWEVINKLYANAFIANADEDGIAVFEKTLGITPTPDETLEQRRTEAAMLWNFSVPFTDNYLMEYLEGIYGVDGYTYEKKPSACEIYITVNSLDLTLAAKVKAILKKIIPAHELMSFKMVVPLKSTLVYHPATYARAMEKLYTSNDFKSSPKTGITLYQALHINTVEKLATTNDFKESVNASGTQNVGGSTYLQTYTYSNRKE